MVTSEPLSEWNRLVGETFDSEDKALFFYSLIKMQKPERILEIGTGVGVSSLYMAHAVKENGIGHVWTIDNGSQWREFYTPYFTDRIKPSPRFAPLIEPDFFATMKRVAREVGLEQHISFLEGQLALNDVEPLDAPVLEEALAGPLDFVFSDIDHRPDACLGILAKFLPLLSPAASIFIDSAPTQLASYLTLEQTIAQLNAGKVPAFFLAGSDPAHRRRMRDLIAARRFTLVSFTEAKERDGNSFAWIKVEPVNVFPAPYTAMRGLNPEKPKARLGGEHLRALFADPGDSEE
jgi:predicted O-methyltransferase YrrM